MPRSTRPVPKGNRVGVAIATLVLLAALYFGNAWNRPAPSASSPSVAGEPATTGKSRGFDRLNGCVLVNGRNNDGDSFLVRHGDQTHELRLYYADSPEKYRHQYNGERLAEQGAYFGGLGERETIRVGEEARDFTLGLLRGNSFTVYTRWENVYNSGRFYAFVLVRDPQGSESYLHELLVARGLARIHTKGIDLPDGTPWRTQKARLAEMEGKARAANLGGWAG